METGDTAPGPAPARSQRPRLDPPNVLWFFGGLTAGAAGIAIVSRVHPSARGLWILLVSLVFLAFFAIVAASLDRAGWTVPGGVLVAAAVVFVAPAVVGLLRLVGFWHDATGLDPLEEYEGPLVLVALSTALAGLFAFRAVRFPFVLAVSAAAVAALGQLLLPLFVTRPGGADHANGAIVTGAVLLAVGIALDRRRARRAAFWWHVFGLATLTLGLAYQAFRNASWGWLLILVAGAGFLAFATLLRRASWALFGVAGFFAAIAHYLDDWLGTLGTAFAIGLVGLGLLVLGIAAQRAPRTRFDT
jgi:hypothetical protein